MSEQPLNPEGVRARHDRAGIESASAGEADSRLNPREGTRAQVQKVLAGKQGREYWQALEELADTDEFKEQLYNEFPPLASVWPDALDRRRFLKVMGASLALAGVASGCGQGIALKTPREQILPYVNEPENVVPGKPLFFASTMPFGGYGLGVLVESHMGRPTKIEGNPDHPASLGGTNVFMQASVLSLYDPDRSQLIVHRGAISTWAEFTAAMTRQVALMQMAQGEGMRILTGTITSPTLASQMEAVLQKYPQAKWHQYDAVSRDNARIGAQMAFGEPVNTVYRFDRANVVVSLDSDFLFELPGSVRYAREFIARRKVNEGATAINRLYVVEGQRSLAGGVADHRLPLRAAEVEGFARALAQRLGIAAGGDNLPEGVSAEWMDAVVGDLQANASASIVVAGEQQPPVVHALAHAINGALGNAGATVVYTAPVEARPTNQAESLNELIRDMAAGRVKFLVMLGGNPVFTTPPASGFLEAMKNVELRVHVSPYNDETSEWSHWHVPEAHYLETWGDIRAFDGTASIIQPLIAPLYEGKAYTEVLSVLLGEAGKTPYDAVRAYWQTTVAEGDFDAFWRKSVHDGVVAGTAFAPVAMTAAARFEPPQAAPTATAGLEIQFRPDPTLWDGSFAHNGWLQELPKPFTLTAWGNAAFIAPGMAERLKFPEPTLWREAELGTLENGGRSMNVPVWLLPGLPDNTVLVHVGHGGSFGAPRGVGRTLAEAVGFNAYALQASPQGWFGTGATLTPAKGEAQLACTQLHHRMAKHRGIVRKATVAEFEAHPDFVKRWEHHEGPAPTVYPSYEYKGYAWGMAIDQQACIGCNACVIACQAENNIPVVGREQIIMGREMHWLRIDTYYGGSVKNPATYFQPMLCQHCEKAPCEPVCPVGATVHGHEGLNEMVYNRCVGTRYCSNNCPWKVRRFNFLHYSDFKTESLKPMRNPDVTTRQRGVMEKCTYCVQRINAARIEAKKSGQRVRDGEIVTACQQACPTRAIVFGDINDPQSAVRALKAQPHNYAVLGELDTQPRTTYLARIQNPHPALGPMDAQSDDDDVHMNPPGEADDVVEVI